MKPGKTGDFPYGKLNEDDEGAITIVVGSEKGNVRIDFGTPVAWLALPPEQATALALSVLAKARALTIKGH